MKVVLSKLGIDSKSRPVFKELCSELVFKDISCGKSQLQLAIVSQNEFEGETDILLKMKQIEYTILPF